MNNEALALKFHNAIEAFGLDTAVDLYESYISTEIYTSDNLIALVGFSDESLCIFSKIPNYEARFVFPHIANTAAPNLSGEDIKIWQHIRTHIKGLLGKKNVH